MAAKTAAQTPKVGRPSLGTENVFRRYGGEPVKGAYGWELYFAKMPCGISVQQKHIDAGKPGAANECVFARAIDDHFGGKFLVEVGLTIVHIIDAPMKRRLTFKLPVALRKRLRLFDGVKIWDLPTGVYFLQAMSKTVRKNRDGRTRATRALPPKNRERPTRLIFHGRVIRVKKAT